MSDDLRDFDELVQSYIEGTLDDEGAAALMNALEAKPELNEQLLRDLRMEALLRSEVPEVEVAVGRQLAQEARLESSSRLRREADLAPNYFGFVRQVTAAAAIFLIGVGLFALWLVPSSPERPLTQRERRRQQVMLDQLNDLRMERASLKLPRPVPAPPKGMPPDEIPVAVEREQGRAEAEEAARFIEARQRFVAQQLRLFDRPKARPDDLDVEPDEPAIPAKPGRPVLVNAGPVGRVVETEGAGVVIRQTEEGSNRIELAKGLPLLSGDRIETADAKDASCTTVRMRGGATLDLARGTAVDVLGRDNLYLRTGRVYGNISVPFPEDSYQEAGPPFSVQTDAGRFLTYELEAEVFLSPHEAPRKELRARVDRGKVHLVNRQGHVVGRKGQELKSLKGDRPKRKEGFSKPIWRGRPRNFKGMPFGRSCPVILSATANEYLTSHYFAALAFRGEINVAGIHCVRTEPAEGPSFEDLIRAAERLDRLSERFPSPIMGAPQALRKPGSGKMADTRPVSNAAVRHLLSQVEDATPSRPVVVICAGPLTDVASAWLLDRRAEKRVVVIAAPNPSQGVKWAENDPWAAKIVLTHFRCVMFKGLQLSLNDARPDRIADPRWRPLNRPDLERDSRFRLVQLVAHPELGAGRTRKRFVGFKDGVPEYTDDKRGNIFYVINEKPDVMLREFERVFLADDRG